MSSIDGRFLGVLFGAMVGPALGTLGGVILGNPALVDLTAVGIVLGVTVGATLSDLLVSASHS